MLILSNSSVSKFTQCPKRYKLNKLDGWKEQDTSNARIVGKAVHKGIEIWAFEKDRDQAYSAAHDTEGMDEDIFEITFALLDAYFDKWSDDEMKPLTTEHDLKFHMDVPYSTEGIEYRAILDGIRTNHEGNWVHEIKTSGMKAGSFWKKYQKDHQMVGNICTAENVLGIPIVGAYIDAIFKPGYQRPDPICERQFFKPERVEKDRWLMNIIEMGRILTKNIEEDSFYESYNCFPGFFTCEFLPYCSNNDNLEVLRSTHEILVDESKDSDNKTG